MTHDGQRLKAARGWAGLSQDELGKQLGHDKQYIARREKAPESKGWYPLSTADKLRVVAICGLPIQWFYVDVPGVLSRAELPAGALGPLGEGALGRDLGAAGSIPEGPPRTASPEEEDPPQDAQQ